MIITVPRYLIVGLAAIFSAYHLMLATVSIGVPRDVGPYVAAMVLYLVATVASLWPSKAQRMQLWMASFNVAVSIAIPLLVISQVDARNDNGYAIWFTAAIGTLMVITSTRRRNLFAWIGVCAVTVETIAWSGF
ncbi:MAG: hypothetical protein QOE21_1148, partial [Microbacteriaceae bacterium]|nr:hypothetical protein [Microbacteriaceae bacterium]